MRLFIFRADNFYTVFNHILHNIIGFMHAVLTIIFISGLTVAREEASALSALSTLLLLHSSSIVSLSKYLPICNPIYNQVLQLFHKRTQNEFKSIRFI